MTPVPSKESACIERHRLSDAYTDAVDKYIRLQLAQVEAVLDGDETRFVKEGREAGKRKDAAKAALILHHRQHGCRPTKHSPLKTSTSD